MHMFMIFSSAVVKPFTEKSRCALDDAERRVAIQVGRQKSRKS